MCLVLMKNDSLPIRLMECSRCAAAVDSIQRGVRFSRNSLH